MIETKNFETAFKTLDSLTLSYPIGRRISPIKNITNPLITITIRQSTG